MGLWCCVTNGAPNTNINFEACSRTTYAAGEPYGNGVAYVLDDITSNAPNASGPKYESVSPDLNALCYGSGFCVSALTFEDCSTCMLAASTEIQNHCAGHIWGVVLLQDCSIAYKKVGDKDKQRH
ncbi:OLC1v1007939C1 [Oldenlandia corymbosa var. corymbosa]|uniref:OLC1v1007939C1 n=1 Tax=Oldenlandia corymbosa var. corymbosa TaxID=529605 RepID=A0AAV1DMV9_OLDCO|nr:OLC1v1007939C1 [Oldenlandia corymbosa var. corymbosa]